MGGVGVFGGEIVELPGIVTNRFRGHGNDAGFCFEVVQSQDAECRRISVTVW